MLEKVKRWFMKEKPLAVEFVTGMTLLAKGCQTSVWLIAGQRSGADPRTGKTFTLYGLRLANRAFCNTPGNEWFWYTASELADTYCVLGEIREGVEQTPTISLEV